MNTKKFLIIGIVCVIVTNLIQAGIWFFIHNSSTKQLNASISQLQATVNSYGQSVTCYTVASGVKAGDEITEASITTIQLPGTYVTSDYVTDSSNLIGQYFKVAVNPGCPILSNMVMNYPLSDDTREHDVMLDSWPVGIAVGDYVDIRITMPYGMDYNVIPHVRIEQVNENTCKMNLSELDWHRYKGACMDYALNKGYGCTIYAAKYVEPGAQKEAIPYYAVPSNIAKLLQYDPNIMDKDEAGSLDAWRASIEELLVIFRDEDDTVDEDGARFAEQVSQYNEAVNSDRTAAMEEEENATDDDVEDDVWADTYTDPEPTSETTDAGEDTSKVEQGMQAVQEMMQ